MHHLVAPSGTGTVDVLKEDGGVGVMTRVGGSDEAAIAVFRNCPNNNSAEP